MDKLKIWPNFFIVGAPRAGTTSLYQYLKETSGVYMSPTKEPNYFSSINASSLSSPPIKDEKKYLKLFSKVKDEKAIGEASPNYLRDPKSPELIHNAVPNSKIIIILRDPVERAYSSYLLRLSSGKTYSFSQAIKQAIESDDDYKTRIINGGIYFESIQRFQKIFGIENVKIFIFEEFIQDETATIKKILSFLGIDSEPPESIELTHNLLTKPRGRISLALLTNKTIRKFGRKVLPSPTADLVVKRILGKKTKKEKIPQVDREFLEKFYKQDAEKIQKMFSRPLPWKLLNN